jgi:hypothetical protein
VRGRLLFAGDTRVIPVSSDGMEMFGVLDLETIFASGLRSDFIIGRGEFTPFAGSRRSRTLKLKPNEISNLIESRLKRAEEEHTRWPS